MQPPTLRAATGIKTAAASGGIIRVTLSSGYRAYRRRDDRDKPRQPRQPQKRVRFAKGHTIIPYNPEPEPESESEKSQDVDGDNGDDDDQDVQVGVQRLEEEACSTKETKESGGARLEDVVFEEYKSQKEKGGRFVDKGGFTVWRKHPRFRGSGRVQVLDDPVRDGLMLARSRVRLPSDGWRDRAGAGLRVRKGGREGLVEAKGLRYDEGERDVGFGMGDIVREEMGYTVKVVDSRRAKGGMSSDAFEGPVAQADGSVAESVVLTEAASGSESERDDDCDFLGDVSLEEADGWVPVMVAGEDEGDNWMSLTGSWVMMGDTAEANK